MDDEQHRDPGAYVGHEPELESESIPGGVTPRDERVSANDSRPGVKGEPDGDSGDSSDVVEGPIGSASLKDPSEGSEGADLDELPDVDDLAANNV